MIPLTIYMDQRTSDITDTIPPNQMAMWFINDIVKIRTGTLTRTLDIGIPLEEIQDLLQNTFVNTSSIEWTYNDNANTYTANLNQALIDKINGALQPSANISALTNNLGFETPAQLANRDIANRNRANHTGTQLASTISNLEAAIFNILDRKPPVQIPYDPLNYSINTTTAPLVIVDENYNPIHTGKYKVVANFGHSYDDGANDNHIEVLVNNSVAKPLKKEPKDVGGSDGASGTDQKETGHFEYIFDAVASTPFNIKLQHYAQVNGVESTVKHLDLYVERYL